MKKLKKVMAVSMAACLSVGMLAGCGGDKKDSSNKDTTKTTKKETTEKDTSSSSKDSELKGDLVYWSMWNDTEPQGEVWQKIADGFMKKYPKVNVKIQWCGRDNKKVLKPALEGGETIDVFEYPFEIDLKDYIMDLKDIVAKPMDSLDGKSIQDTVQPNLLTTPKTLLGIEDKTPAVGYKPWMSLFMYDQAAFDKAGVKEAPKTWEDLDAVCAKLKDAGYSPITFDDAYASWLPGMYLAREKGQEWVQKLVQDKTGEMWKDDAVVRMAKAYEDFAKKGYFDANVSGNKYPAGQMDIANEKVAMYYNLTGLTTEVSDVTGDDYKWGGFSFPDVVDGANKAGVEDPYGCTPLAINKDTKNPELAAEFIAYALSPENDEEMVKTAGTTPATLDTEWPDSLVGMKSSFDSIQVQLKSGADITSNADLAPSIQENFVKLASGQISADEFVSNMANAAK